MNKKNQLIYKVVAGLLVLVFVLVSCTPAPTAEPQAEEPAAPAEEEMEETTGEESSSSEETMEEASAVLNKVFYGDTWTWPYQPSSLAHMALGRFFVPIQDESKIAVIDPDAPDYGLTFVETEFIQPHHPWVAPGMRWNWINFQSDGVDGGVHDVIAVQDTQTLEIVKYIHTGANDPFHMAFSPTQDVLVTADINGAAGRVYLFDTAKMELMGIVETQGTQTRDITISHDGKYAFIGHQGYDPDNGNIGAVNVLDIAKREIVATFGQGRCRSGKMNNAGTLVMYSCDRTNEIVVIDVTKLELVKTIKAPDGSGPFNISFRPDDKFAYVGLSEAGQIGVIDMEQLEIVKTLDSGDKTNSTYPHPTAPLAVVTNDGGDTHVTILNTETNEVVGMIETAGKSTHNGQWSADGRWFLVTNRGGDTVTLLQYNAESGEIEWVADIVVGFGSNGVHWAPYFCGVEELTADNVMEATNAAMADASGACQ